MSKEYKRARSILILGIVSMLLLLIAIILLVVGFTSGVTFATVSTGSSVEGEITSQAFAILVIAIITLVLTIITDLVVAILILASRFNNKQVDDLKIIMGILTLLLIGPIGAIVFGGIAMSKLKYKSSAPNI